MMTKPIQRCAIRRLIVALGAALALGATVAHAQDTKPRGYLVANFSILQPDTFQKYLKAAGSLPAKYNGKVIIFDEKASALEGNPQTVTVVVEFPTVADAERFYNSPEYAATKPDRLSSTVGSLVLAEGRPPKP